MLRMFQQVELEKIDFDVENKFNKTHNNARITQQIHWVFFLYRDNCSLIFKLKIEVEYRFIY